MPNVVDFFTGQCADGSPSDDVTNAAEFGLCDDPHEAGTPKKRAYVDTSDPSKWIATVINRPRFEVTFKGVDDCITINKSTPADEQVEEESRCDGILLYEDTIVFVELKNKKRSWLKSSIDQLQLTIQTFTECHDIDSYKFKRAYTANKAHPLFNENRNQRANTFFKELGIVLRPEATINLEPLL